MWDGPLGLIKEIKKCENHGSAMAAVALSYVCIDMMSFLSMPEGKQAQTKDDFIAWVNAYMKGLPSQPYKYTGIDVYAARCALLHSFGSEAQLHRNDANIKMFAYHDGGKHAVDAAVNPRLVIVGTASLINDVVIAVSDFMDACKADAALRARAEARLGGVLAVFPVK